MTTELAWFEGRRLLFLNWRDLTHPQAGGAELYTHRLASRFAAAGADVTLFTAHHGDAPLSETRDGFHIIREGGTYDVYGRALRHLQHRRARYDGVVDFQNGIPFFAPLAAAPSTGIVLVCHHVHQQQFRHHFSPAVSAVGRLLEGPMSRRVYGDRPVVAVSPSTRTAIRQQLGLTGPIFVVPNGVDRIPHTAVRSPTPHVATITRLVPQKRLERLVDAAATLREAWPDLRVDIAGDGPARDALQRRIRERGVADVVHLHGRVSDEVRARLLSQAWLTVLPSEREGWGLTILEANTVGTPGIAYEVPGLRDAIVDGDTGWLAGPGDTLAGTIDRALDELADPRRAADRAARCRRWAARFSWDDSAHQLAAVLRSEIERARRLRRSNRRRTGNLAVVARFDVAAGDGPRVSAALGEGLRVTDRFRREGDTFTVMLHGSDEAEATRTLRRLGIRVPVRFTVATPQDRLTGPTDPVHTPADEQAAAG